MTDRATENTGLGRENPNSPASVDVERQPIPSRAPDVDSDRQDEPPARSGNVAENTEKPTEGDPVDNPVHHTGTFRHP